MISLIDDSVLHPRSLPNHKHKQIVMTTYAKRDSTADHWQSSYADTYCYKDPLCFKRQVIYHQPPSIQNPSNRSVDSHRFQTNYIPKLLYCRPPGKGNHDAVSLNLGTFDHNTDKLNLKSMYQFKLGHIQKGFCPKNRRAYIINKNNQNEETNRKIQEKIDKFNYHNLVKNNRNSGCELSTNELTFKKLNESDKNKLSKIHGPAVWTTNTERSQLQSAIPIKNVIKVGPELEVSSDTVRYKANRYGSGNSEPWQKFSAEWDNVQIRDEAGVDRDNSPRSASKLNQKKNKCSKERPKCNDLVEHSQSRHLPGYSGYVPRLPIGTSQQKLSENSSTATFSEKSRRTTSMQRHFPNYEISESSAFRPQKSFARKGVMSNTITLVQPHNPFNKIRGVDCYEDCYGKMDELKLGKKVSSGSVVGYTL